MAHFVIQNTSRKPAKLNCHTLQLDNNIYPSSYIKTDHISTSTRFMVTLLGRLDPMITWSHEVTWLIKSEISPLPRGPWLPNLTRWTFIVKSHHLLSLLTFWSRDRVITWQIKNVKAQRPRDLWLPNLAEWWVLIRAYYPSSHTICWSRDHIKSHDK